MKILVTLHYRKQSYHLFCHSKTTITQLRVQVNETGGVLLMNHRQVGEVFKVDHIDIDCTFVHKNGRTNQEQEVTPKCILSMVLNLHIITIVNQM